MPASHANSRYHQRIARVSQTALFRGRNSIYADRKSRETAKSSSTTCNPPIRRMRTAVCHPQPNVRFRPIADIEAGCFALRMKLHVGDRVKVRPEHGWPEEPTGTVTSMLPTSFGGGLVGVLQ